MSVPRPSTSSASSSSGPQVYGDDRGGRPLRSKGLLPAIGVGAVVYFVTGAFSLSTLGLIGVGAGVGYGVGSWIAGKFQKDDRLQNASGMPMEQLPWAVQVALLSWQEFLTGKAVGRQLAPADVDHIWAEFERVEPTHAMNARMLVRGNALQPSPVVNAGNGVKIVPNAAQV
mmetsp:Transcript_42884/g.79584  ORF Transcript_42884/g.79584 Transcript_42884/m.79584 type:complete len:172 (-) Transcript_42884:8-523(-)